jgi:hypothetical protein
MIKIRFRKAKVAALLTGGVLMASALATTTAPAHADTSKEKLYKGGAVALGVLGGYWILKGKTLPGAVAAAGAYYAYKKGQEANEEDQYYGRDIYPDDHYSTQDRNRASRNRATRDRTTNNRYPDYRAPGDYGYSGMTPSSTSDSTIVLR